MQATFSRAVVESSDSNAGSAAPERPAFSARPFEKTPPHVACTVTAHPLDQHAVEPFGQLTSEQLQCGQSDLHIGNSSQRIKQRTGAKPE